MNVDFQRTMSEEGKERFLRKAERQACWDARDTFWKCLDATGQPPDESKCVDLRKKYAEMCPPTWVTHFDRKYQYEKFKAKMMEVGKEQLDDDFTKKQKQWSW